MHPVTRLARLAVAGLFILFAATGACAQAEPQPTAEALAAQIQAIKTEYHARIEALEARLAEMEAKPPSAPAAARTASTTDNAFNPAIGVTLDGRVAAFSADAVEIPGFQPGHEGERGAEGLSLGHTEATLSSNVDDKFHGSVTLGLDAHPGEPVALELEEAFIQTLPGAGLPDGLRAKAGRALWTFGYLNELHAHGDDFADRPLPYRAYLSNAWNDDGVELSLVLPSDFYSEIGGGMFRGDDLPFGGSDDGMDAWSAWARVGGDIGRNAAWRVGGYVLVGRARNRGGGGVHAHNGDDDHGDHDAS